MQNVWSMVAAQQARQHTSVTTVDELWHLVEAAWVSVLGHAIQSLLTQYSSTSKYCPASTQLFQCSDITFGFGKARGSSEGDGAAAEEASVVDKILGSISYKDNCSKHSWDPFFEMVVKKVPCLNTCHDFIQETVIFISHVSEIHGHVLFVKAAFLKLSEFNIEWEHRAGVQNVVADVLSWNPVGNLDGSQISCAALRALALNSREQLIREQREDPELGHIYRYLQHPDDGSLNATICEVNSDPVRVYRTRQSNTISSDSHLQTLYEGQRSSDRSSRSQPGKFKGSRKTSNVESNGHKSSKGNAGWDDPRLKRKVESNGSGDRKDLKRSKFCRKRSLQGSEHRNQKRPTPEPKKGIKRAILSSVSSRNHKYRRPNNPSQGSQPIAGPSHPRDSRQDKPPTEGSRHEGSEQYNKA
ncbi:uncharacterized protein TNCV_490251 [Trichonephila clavipes]|nr:uncharacterized protein TNCV_490251 [Trichonephila clavipes]